MRKRTYTQVGVAATALLTACCFMWGAMAEDQPSPEQPTVSKLTQQLGGADRYLTHVTTDKPMYKPGETMYMRGVVLHHATHKPMPEGHNATAMIEISGPKGDTVAQGNVASQDSVYGFSWTVPKDQAGGEYNIRLMDAYAGGAPAECTFDVRAYRAPRLKSQIKFLRDGYGAGDDVAATLEVTRAEGGVPAGAKVTIIARVDGEEAYRGNSKVNAKGQCVARFQLPAEIVRGEGSLAMVIEDGGVVETASKTIPILLQTVDLNMYPEGGELVAGLSNRVYLEAFTPAKKPADLAGVIVDSKGKTVAKFRSQHEGRGRFAFTPQADETYRLKITEPSGIHTEYPLPEVKKTGVMIASKSDVTSAADQVALTVGASQAGDYTVTLMKRDVEIASTETKLQAGKSATIQLDAKDFDGVLTATVWDKDGKPLAERLVFRQPVHNLNVSIEADANRYVPGGKAAITIQTTDSHGKPISAVVGVTVTDDSVLEMVDKRKQRGGLPVMVLLEGEVKELADAHIYLDPENQDAPLAVDLLLGTQGWRRFATVNTADFLIQGENAARRVLALKRSTIAELSSALQVDEAVLEKAVDRFAENKNEDADDLAPVDVAPQKDPAAPVVEPVPPVNAEPVAGPPPAPEPLDIAPIVAAPAGAAARPVVAGEQEPEMPAFAKRKQEAFRDAREQINRKRDELDLALEEAQDKRRNRKLIAGKPFGGRMAHRQDFKVVRVYAHELRAGRVAGQRVDFTETLFWHAGIKTDETGKATIEFALNDSVTSFRVAADGFAATGAIGSNALQIESVEPFYVEPKMPLELTQGDEVLLPIGVVNATDAAMNNTLLRIMTGNALKAAESEATFNLTADQRLRRIATLHAAGLGAADVTIAATAGPYSDQVTRSVVIMPQGFPVELGRGGLISPGDTVSHEIIIPADLVPGSVTATIKVYPTPLASMNESLKRLIREPGGCFEQTSSTVYPLVMAQQYFMSHEGVDPALVEQSADILERGYQRLIGFECKTGGFEWFGADPGHDALTAYGLLEFTDMSQVRYVDPEMLKRTREWLLTQRDGKGGFERKTHTYHTWITDPECQYPYNTWALLEAGVQTDLSQEVEWARQAGEKTQNTYAVALAANVCGLAGDKDGENHLLDKLAGSQNADGSLDGATTSVVGSGGDALKIETTALAVMAWLRNDRYAPNVEKSIKYLAESCKGGRFGSTQSTVLALRAVVAYDASRARPKAPGSVQLIVDGKPFGEAVAFTEDTSGAIELPAPTELLTPGKHQVQIQMTDGSRMPYSVTADFNRLQPDSAEECKLHMHVKLNDAKLEEGGLTEVQVSVINRTNEDVPTPIAIVGVPGGLEVRHDQLKELVKEGKIAAYEVKGREVVLYWRAMKAEQRVDLPISLTAAIPGKYTAPASRAYLYYTDEHKHWTNGLNVEITAKQ